MRRNNKKKTMILGKLGEPVLGEHLKAIANIIN